MFSEEMWVQLSLKGVLSAGLWSSVSSLVNYLLPSSTTYCGSTIFIYTLRSCWPFKIQISVYFTHKCTARCVNEYCTGYCRRNAKPVGSRQSLPGVYSTMGKVNALAETCAQKVPQENGFCCFFLVEFFLLIYLYYSSKLSYTSLKYVCFLSRQQCFILNIYFCFMCRVFCHPCICVPHVLACVLGGQKRKLDSLGLEFQLGMSCPLGAGSCVSASGREHTLFTTSW